MSSKFVEDTLILYFSNNKWQIDGLEFMFHLCLRKSFLETMSLICGNYKRWASRFLELVAQQPHLWYGDVHIVAIKFHSLENI